MKRAYTLLIMLFLVFGATYAQEVYFAGNSNGIGMVWKDSTLVTSVSDSLSLKLSALQLTSERDIYTAGYAYDSLPVQGRIWLNDSLIFAAATGSVFSRLALHDSVWTAIGGNQVWRDGELLYAYQLDSLAVSTLYALAIDTATGDLYAGGSLADSIDRATVWKNDTILWQSDVCSCITDMVFYGTDLYATGYCFLEGIKTPTLWKNDSIIFSINELESDISFSALSVYDGNIYVAGLYNNTLVIWQNGEVLYDHSLAENGEITALAANEFGVYYAGVTDSVATVWKDGEVLYQVEDCNEITAICVLPTLPLPPQVFTLTVEADTTGWGSVIGGGEFLEGDTATIEAIPNIGGAFLYWNDSVTDNPRNIIILSDSTFTAYFKPIDYLIETSVLPEEAGTVTEGGIYHYNDTITLEATANPGFVFIGWNDSITDNPRNIVVTQDSLFTALFDIKQCLVTVEVSPEDAGIVTGGGNYSYGSVIQLEATANEGHEFMHWDDGVTDNPRTVTVQGDSVFVALFSTFQYEIITEAAPVEAGIVTGGGVYDHGTVATLTATSNEGYSFICWHDGIVSNPRDIIVTQDGYYKAMFSKNAPQQYTVMVVSNDSSLGIVIGGGTFDEGDTIEIAARPYDHARFTRWDDGIADNPRSIIVGRDMTLTALFEARPLYTISVTAENPTMGTVYGEGVYIEGTTISIGATPYQGYHFTGWQDGEMNNPRTITVTENASYTASFAETPITTHTLTVNCNEELGFIIGSTSGSYVAGTEVTIAAIPRDGYRFDKWDDGITDNPRHLTIDSDITLTALFVSVGIDESQNQMLRLYPNPTNDFVRIEGMDGENELKVFNAMGVLVRNLTVIGDTSVSISDLPAGIYVICIGNNLFKLMKE